MQAYMRMVIKVRWWIIAVGLALTVVALFQFKHLNIIVDPDAALPKSHPLVKTSMELDRLFGNKFLYVVGITPKNGDIYQRDILIKVQLMTREILRLPGVVKSNTNSLATRKMKNISGDAEGMVVRPLMESVPDTPEAMAQLRAGIASNPAYENVLVSKNGKTVLIVAEFAKIPGGFHAVDKNVRSVIDHHRDATVDIEAGGTPVILSLLEQFSERMGLLFPLALILIALVLYVAFGTLQAMFLPLVTALIAVIWSLGLLGVFGQPFDVFNAATPVLVLAIAAGHAVQMLKRYYEEYRLLAHEQDTRASSREAVVRSLTKVGPVMIVAGMVAALGFLSLIVFDIRSIRVFGIFTAAGIISALILELTWVPAMRAVLPPPKAKEMQREQRKTVWDRVIQWAYHFATERRSLLFKASAAAIVMLSLGGLMLHVDDSQKGYFYGSLEQKRDDDSLNNKMAGTNTISVLIRGDSEDRIKDPAVLRGMEAVQQFLIQQEGVGKTLSIVDFIKRMNQAMHGDDPQFSRVPDSRELVAQYLLLYSTSGEPGDFDSYVDADYRNAIIVAYVKSDSTAFATDLFSKLQTYAQTQFGPGVEVAIGGGIANTVALTETMVREKILNIIQIMAAVMLVSALALRSIVAGVMILVPLLAAVFVNFGIMGLFGIPLQIGTSLISAMAVGIGADYAIYMSYRMREELRAGGDEQEAIKRAFFSAGKATLFVSSAVSAGFAVLMLSWGFWVHFYLGLLVGIAMIVSALTTLTLFPGLIFKFRPKFIYGKE
ncbi:MAG: MMPL family transporter [Gammaproteobacteria bacterium]|nr:MMPL family transporter [Gammaproteobacteria bacterium]